MRLIFHDTIHVREFNVKEMNFVLEANDVPKIIYYVTLVLDLIRWIADYDWAYENDFFLQIPGLY